VTPFVGARAAAALVGILVFVYGVRSDSGGLRWAGIGLLGAAFLLRFIDPARRR
jgi:hypothetical protein